MQVFSRCKQFKKWASTVALEGKAVGPQMMKKQPLRWWIYLGTNPQLLHSWKNWRLQGTESNIPPLCGKIHQAKTSTDVQSIRPLTIHWILCKPDKLWTSPSYPFLLPQRTTEAWFQHSNQQSYILRYWERTRTKPRSAAPRQLSVFFTWKSRFSRETRLVMGSIAPASTGFRAPHLNFNIFTAYLI